MSNNGLASKEYIKSAKLSADQSPHEYREKSSGRIFLALGVMFLIAVFSIFILIRAFKTWKLYVDIFIGLGLGIISFVLIILLYRPQRILVSREGIFIYKRNVLKKTYPISSLKKIRTIKNFTNGIYTGNTRFFIFKGEKKDICEAILLPDDAFKDMVKDLNILKTYGGFIAHGILEKRTSEKEIEKRDIRFEIKKDDVIKKCRGKFKRDAITILIVICVMSGLYFSYCLLTGKNGFALSGLMVLLVTVCMFIFGVVISNKHIIDKMTDSMPYKIVLQESGIVLDGYKRIDVGEIKHIDATPDGYVQNGMLSENKLRKIIIETHDGKTKLYMGPRRPNGHDADICIRDYEGFVNALRLWCTNRDIDFREDLE